MVGRTHDGEFVIILSWSEGQVSFRYEEDRLNVVHLMPERLFLQMVV